MRLQTLFKIGCQTNVKTFGIVDASKDIDNIHIIIALLRRRHQKNSGTASQRRSSSLCIERSCFEAQTQKCLSEEERVVVDEMRTLQPP